MKQETHTEPHECTEHPRATIQQLPNNIQDSTPITNTNTTTPTTPTTIEPNGTTHRKSRISTKENTTNNTPTTTDLTEAFQGGNRDVHTIHDPG
jgi:hypothetical protein